MTDNIDLMTIFQSVTEQLTQKKETLNEADTFNHDHGDHMVQIFSLIQNAVSKKSDKPISEQLEYASKVVEKKAQSGSATLYTQGLSTAAKNLSGADLNAKTIQTLVSSLLNAEKPVETPKPQANTDILGSLLSGFTGASEPKQTDQGFGIDELLKAGLAFYQQKQEGGSTIEALIGALLSSSPLGQSSHRSQSGALVASTIMNFAKYFM